MLIALFAFFAESLYWELLWGPLEFSMIALKHQITPPAHWKPILLIGVLLYSYLHDREQLDFAHILVNGSTNFEGNYENATLTNLTIGTHADCILVNNTPGPYMGGVSWDTSWPNFDNTFQALVIQHLASSISHLHYHV